jgi:hypothetical protein
MSVKTSSPKRPAQTDVRYDYVDTLPPGIPPVEKEPTSDGPGEATYYFPVPLDGCNPTGVFFPTGYSFPCTMNVILYFHGHMLGEFKTINEYWDGSLHDIRLREDINASGKQAVLIAPTLGEFPGRSLHKDMGIFSQAGAGDDFLAEVARWIGKYVPQYTARKLKPGIGNVVLAGHSGAGGILSRQAKTMQSRVCEVWGFDSMCGQASDPISKKPIDVADDWRETAAARHKLAFDNAWGLFPYPRPRPSTWFHFYWAEASSGVHSRDLQERARQWGLTNVTVEANTRLGGEYHFDALTSNFKKRVAEARCF